MFVSPVLRGTDPSVNVVLLEDFAAVIGVAIAATSMGLTTYFHSPIYDSIGSIAIGSLLGVVASFIIYTNSGALVGRSIPSERLEEINKQLENDEMVRAIHDVKATDMGNEIVRYKGLHPLNHFLNKRLFLQLKSILTDGLSLDVIWIQWIWKFCLKSDTSHKKIIFLRIILHRRCKT